MYTALYVYVISFSSLQFSRAHVCVFIRIYLCVCTHTRNAPYSNTVRSRLTFGNNIACDNPETENFINRFNVECTITRFIASRPFTRICFFPFFVCRKRVYLRLLLIVNFFFFQLFYSEPDDYTPIVIIIIEFIRRNADKNVFPWLPPILAGIGLFPFKPSNSSRREHAIN